MKKNNFIISNLEKKLFIQKNIKNAPNETGCYLFSDEDEKIIYIGKAKNLKKRIENHFSSHNKDHFHRKIHKFSIILTENEKEALILEQNLIKNYKPRFNVLLKDDHSYPYLEITSSLNPSYKITRNINYNKKGGDFFGPFPDGSKAKEILNIIERLFPLAKCKGKLGKPCFYYSINMCSGHCFKEVDFSYYQDIKKKIKNFFEGKTEEIKKMLEKSIKKNIIKLAFEEAREKKKILESIDFLTSKQNINLIEEKNCDFLGFFLKNNIVSFFILIYRYGKLIAVDEFIFRIWTNLENVLENYIYQFYQKNSLPNFIYLPEEIIKTEINFYNLDLKFKKAEMKNEIEILELAKKNARQSWEKNHLNNFQQTNKIEIIEKISKFLSIPIPYYFECLDISNIHEKDVVAFFLSFTNGEKDFSKSKLYKLDNLDQNSDISRIKKACKIHYKKFIKEKLPDLIIVDGGIEQVKSVKIALKELNLKTNIIGLVKNDKHKTSSVIFQNLEKKNFNDEEIKNFFSNCQKEVHYYAINFHRKLHRKNVFN